LAAIVTVPSFDTFRDSLQRLGGVAQVDAATLADIQEAASALTALPEVTRSSLAEMVSKYPGWVPYLGLCVGLTQEGLKNNLNHAFGTSSWSRLARERPEDLIAMLDQEFGLVAEVETQRARSWTFADVLVAKQASRARAGGAIGRGRRVEDAVEAVVNQLGLPHAMRGRFEGRDGRDAPCDLAIPGDGPDAAIVCAVKGFDSTGSKLTAAVKEIEDMGNVRLPRQYVFAVVDGIGWLGRQADLRRIHAMWVDHSIDGVFTLSMLADFKEEVQKAATRLGLLPA
jgi:hypothetical protein